MLTKTKQKIPDLTKDAITQSALKELRANGARVHKTHNIAGYKKRQYQVEKGVSDITGYSSQGVHIECEVKTVSDKFSHEQIVRLSDIDKCGGIALVAVQEGYQAKIIPWRTYCIEKFISQP